MAIYSWFTHEKLWFSITMLVYQRVPKPCKSHRTASSLKTPVLSLRNASQCAVWMDLNWWIEAKKLPQAFRQGLINGIWLPVLQPACWRSGASWNSKQRKRDLSFTWQHKYQRHRVSVEHISKSPTWNISICPAKWKHQYERCCPRRDMNSTEWVSDFRTF